MLRLLVNLGLCASLPVYAWTEPDAQFGPSKEVAGQRGVRIFNAVHDSMRQWGSSLHHNGMSFYLATIPEGVLLHHGNNRPESPTEPDWLAYEIEHAEAFARGRRGGPGGGPGHGRPPPARQQPGSPDKQQVLNGESWDQPKVKNEGGWLHVYRTSRPLKFLYIDGMGGGKTSMGTLDTQDYLLRGIEPRKCDEKELSDRAGGPMDEKQRAADLCEMCQDWGLQGVIRMEAGFEIIKCDFSDGLEEIQALQRPDPSSRDDYHPGSGNLEFIRGLAERYQGIGSSRTAIDYSSMVSAYFFPMNLTNSNAKRPDLPRLSSASKTELIAVKTYLTTVINRRREESSRTIDWQDASDMIVGRYSDRLELMARKVFTVSKMAQEINFLLDVFVDYSQEEPNLPAAITRCANYYLRAIMPVTEADVLLHTAFRSVTSEICSTLFKVRDLVVVDKQADSSSLSESIGLLRNLMDYLQWVRFKRCPTCSIDEVCLIPMWPFGSVEDYENPRCSNGSDTHDGDNYWGGFGRRPDECVP